MLSNKPNSSKKYILPSCPYLALFLFLFACYLLTYIPYINSSDGLAMFATAENIVRRGALDIEQIRWMDLQQGTYGLDGLLYSRKGIGLPLGLLPLTWLGLMIPWWGTVSVSLLFNAIVTALTGTLLLTYIQRLGFSLKTGIIAALTYGLATLAWPYAKSLFSDPFSGLLLLAAALLLLIYQQKKISGENTLRHLLYPLGAGLFLGWNIATRYAEILFVPIFGLLLLYYLDVFKRPIIKRILTPHPWPPIIAFSTPIILTSLTLFAFNLSRYGDPFNTGYLPNETFSGVLWQGILGQLISPGRGLLLYSPILILSFWGIIPAFRRFRPEALLASSIILVHLLLYGKWFMWHGGFAWGPRFLIPTLPFWMIFLTPVVEGIFGKKDSIHHYAKSRLFRIIYITLIVLGIVPQILTLSLDFSPFQNYLLETGLPMFDPQTFFNPLYSPLIAGWTLLKLQSLDLIWIWNGQFNTWLFVVIIANIILTGVYLVTKLKSKSTSFIFQFLALLSTLLALFFIVAHTHTLPPNNLQQTVTELNKNSRTTDAIILNDPLLTADFAELYKGRAPVLGLNSGGFPLPDDINKRLTETTTRHSQIWWLPNWLPPQESAIEQTLLASGFRARNDIYGDQRLALFAFPNNLVAQDFNATFDESITLKQIKLPDYIEGDTALPIEFQWQPTHPIPNNYHVFIHLHTQDGQMLAQSDGQPALWTRPTTTWAVNEIIIDRHALWQPEIPSGTHTLTIGLYNPDNGERLRLQDDKDALQLPIIVH